MQQDRLQRRHGSLGRPRDALVLVLLATTAILSGCEPRPLVAFSERFETPSTVLLKILVEDGAVTVTEGPPGVVSVSGEHPENVHQYTGTVAAGEARIELRRRRTLEVRIGQRGAHLDVQIPRGSTVEIDASNGPVRVTGVFEVGTVKSSNGEVEVTDARGPLTVDASNGRTSIARHDGALTVRASNGALHVSEQRGGPVLLSTSNGAIRYGGTIEAASTNTLETSNGAIEVIVSGTASFLLDATASNGGVTSRFAVLEATTADSRLTGRVGEGGARLELRTSNGAIEVR